MNARAEKFTDDLQNISVGDLFAHGVHGDLVREIVEEAFDVGIDDNSQPRFLCL
jgi:hypothetical protein